MSLMQNTSDINKTGKQVYLVTLIKESTDQPMYLDQMVYKSAAAGQKFMANLTDAFVRAGYRKQQVDADHYKLSNGLDKISLTGKQHDIFED